MSRFHIKADCYIEADDIDDVFLLLAKHFIDCGLGNDSPVVVEGSIDIKPAPSN